LTICESAATLRHDNTRSIQKSPDKPAKLAAGIEGLDPVLLSESEINGRQIKTTIRLAQGLARQQGVEASAFHIRATLAVSQQFRQDLKEG
jgi:hypothetical protein